MSSFLISILVFPILANTPYILGLWLKEIPDYTVTFTKLVLINGLIDTTNSPTIISVLATGKIRIYELIVGSLFILNLPLSYIALKMGCEPTATMVIAIILAMIVTFVRAIIVCKLIGFVFSRYLIMYLRLLAACAATWLFSYFTLLNPADSIFSFLWQSMLMFVVTVVFFFVIAFKREDSQIIFNYISRRLHK